MNYLVNIGDIEQGLLDLGGEARAKSIQDHVLKIHCAGSVPENYQDERSFRQTIQRKIEDYCPQAEGFDATKKEPKFIRVGRGVYRHAAGSNQKDSLAVEEVESPEGLIEGATKVISVNAYERNALARKLCIAHHGYSCVCCGFDFEKTYGELGKSFIHVHHVRRLADLNGAYVVDPIVDLLPLCANCHAMVHRVSPPLSIEELKATLRS